MSRPLKTMESRSVSYDTLRVAAVAGLLACSCAAFADSSATDDQARARAAGAQLQLEQALAYEHGEGVEKDQLKAAALYCDAARAGNVDATFNLGWMYANGRGVARDDAVAAALFARAAEQGRAQAQQMLRFVDAGAGALPDCMRADPVLGQTPPADPVDPYAAMPPEKKKIADLVVRTAPKYTIEPDLALAIIAAESNFQVDARSDKGALGLMQLIPATAARFNVKNRLSIDDNVQGGLAYLRWLLAYYEGQVPLAVAAYNAGEGAVDKYRGIPPYPETREYVQRVLRMYPTERHVYDPSIVDPSPMFAPVGDPR